MTLAEMLQKRAELVKQARDLIDRAEEEKRDMETEEREQYDKIFAEARELGDKIKREQDLREEERKLAANTPEPEKKTKEDPKEKETRAFRSFLKNGVITPEFRALQADDDASGGYVVAPEQFVRQLITGLDNSVFMRALSTVYQINAGTDTLGAPYLNTDIEDATWTTEVAAVDEDTALDFGKRQWTPHQLTKLEKVSMKLLRVSAIPAEDIVRQRMEYKFGTTMENAFLNGSGSSQPLGVFKASDDGISTSRDISTDNTETAFTADGLLNAKYAVAAQYRRRGSWILHRDGIKMASKLKDGEGQYLWKPGLTADEPDRLLGSPVYESEYAPSTFTTGKYVGIFGDFSYYWIADMMQFELQRLIELYAANSQVGFIGRMWSDGMPVLESAFARVTLG